MTTQGIERTLSDEAPHADLRQLSLFEAASQVEVAYEVVDAPEEAVQSPYEVVDAPLSQFGHKGLPRTFKKANAAVHVHATKGRYSLTMRRLFNALLALSLSKISEMPAGTVEAVVSQQKVIRFEAWGIDIKRLIGGETNKDYASLYEMLTALTVMPVVWDVLSSDGESWEKHTTLLSQWERSKESGKLAWAWMPDLFGLLFDPDNPFTPLDLELTRKFNSRYTLALYENCFRYRKIKKTAWRPARDWVLLIAGPDRYKDYREFKRTVLKTAMTEMAETPDCSITVELEEARGLYNRVTELRFLIHLKPQLPLELSLPADVSPTFLQQLRKLGVADAKISQLVREHDIAFLQAQLQFTLREAKRRHLANPAGFFIASVEDRYESDLATAEAQTQELLQQRIALDHPEARESKQAIGQAQDALEWVATLPTQKQTALQDAFLATASFTVKRSAEKMGINHKSVRIGWGLWLKEQPEFKSVQP